MLFSTNTTFATDRPDLGLFGGVEILIDGGFPALDLSFFNYDFVMQDDYVNRAKSLRSLAQSHGAIFNQAHAPFGGGYEKYTTQTVPNLPRIFEFAGICGVKNIVVHPLQDGRYYGREEEFFERNMEFYSKLAPYAKSCGVKIAIENMWQRHPVTKAIVDDVCANPTELVRYYDTLSDPDAFTVCLDLGHVAICGREPEDAVRTIGHDRLGAIHAHDVDYVNDLHTLPGVSKLDYNAICHALADIDYQGDFTLEAESFAKKYPTDHLPAVIRFMADTARYYANKIEEYKKELKK
jgi:sugar phosphate isomerase/epimerase